MVDVQEHIYYDDPTVGHPDVRTRLKNASYFFLGNGMIQLAIQWSPEGEGSTYGLVFMDPNELTPKRDALSFEESTGFGHSMLSIREENQVSEPGQCAVEWDPASVVPTVIVSWRWKDYRVSERFYCQDMDEPELFRIIEIENHGSDSSQLILQTELPESKISVEKEIQSGDVSHIVISYRFEAGQIRMSVVKKPAGNDSAMDYWMKRPSDVDFGDPLLNHLFKTSVMQLPATISQKGVVDASIWQYNREWVRDHSFMVVGLTLSGHHERARSLLRRLFSEFVSDEGSCVDSSEKRDSDDVELDQNGALVWALHQYVLWTGDTALVKSIWPLVKKTVLFPFQETFYHQPSGMLVNCREYWERHRVFGVKDGIELMYQVFPVIGLQSAVALALIIGQDEDVNEWERMADTLKENILSHPTYKMVDEQGFIKRRRVDGSVQDEICPETDSGLPYGVPLKEDRIHKLRPDTCAALPISLGFVDAQSDVARATLVSLEKLWNEEWAIGGHGRYASSSEADCAGPWPIGSLLVAKAALEAGDSANVWRTLRWMNTLTGSAAGSWFEMYGNRISPPYAQVGLLPWTWGEILMLFVQHMMGFRPFKDGIEIRPRILTGLLEVKGRIPFRGKHIYFQMTVCDDLKDDTFIVNGISYDSNDGVIRVQYKGRDIELEIRVPQLK